MQTAFWQWSGVELLRKTESTPSLHIMLLAIILYRYTRLKITIAMYI